MRISRSIVLACVGASCATKPPAPTPDVVTRPMPGLQETPMKDFHAEAEQLKAELKKKYGDAQAVRIDRGVDQVISLWRPTDGDLSEFVRAQFVPEGPQLEALFKRLEYVFEQVDGRFLEIGR